MVTKVTIHFYPKPHSSPISPSRHIYLSISSYNTDTQISRSRPRSGPPHLARSRLYTHKSGYLLDLDSAIACQIFVATPGWAYAGLSLWPVPWALPRPTPYAEARPNSNQRSSYLVFSVCAQGPPWRHSSNMLSLATPDE